MLGRPLRRKLAISEPGDRYEQEADRIADQVMASSSSGAVTPTPIKVQRFTGSPSGPPTEVPASVERVLASSGQPLEPSLREDMEARFGYDFSRVRIHTDSIAEQSSHEMNANAFTVGSDIVFGRFRFAPETPEGQQLIAHELTHVAQTSIDEGIRMIRRQVEYPIAGMPSEEAHTCHRDFCRAFSSREEAERDRNENWPWIYDDIVSYVGRDVATVWQTYAFGNGSPVEQDLSRIFTVSFMRSDTTRATTEYLVGELQSSLEEGNLFVRHGETLPWVPMSAIIAEAIADIENPRVRQAMVFTRMTDPPGNLAGGIGDTDRREGEVFATLIGQEDSIRVAPKITYLVGDTVDLCPGDCGSPREQQYTVPMSRWEATGITSDVRFVVRFTVRGRDFDIRRSASEADGGT